MPGWTGDRPSGRVDREVALADTPLNNLAFRDRGEHVDVALGELCAHDTVAVGGVTKNSVRALLGRLLVDQVLGLRAV